MGLKGAFVHIAGSAGVSADPVLLRRCHAYVRGLTRGVLARGGGLVTTTGTDACLLPGDDDTARLFHWTVVDEVTRFAHTPEGGQRKVLAYLVASSKNEAEIPDHRRPHWEALLATKKVRVTNTHADWNAGAYLRHQQVQRGHALVTLGGGEGVEHLASLHYERASPIIPLDPEIGSFHGDGRGAPALFKDALARPERFVADKLVAQDLPARLRLLSLKGDSQVEQVVDRTLKLLEDVVVQRVFLIRLQNKDQGELQAVDMFFSGVVVPELKAMGYEPDEVGQSLATEATIDREVFQHLHYASAVVADLTGLRSNVLLELGYALGRPLRTIVTAMKGTEHPFDIQGMQIHIWKAGVSLESRRKAFREFWERCIDRPPLVEPRN